MPDSATVTQNLSLSLWRETWVLARQLWIQPSQAVQRFMAPHPALPASARLYLLFMIASILFYTFKPPDFPPPDLGMEWTRVRSEAEEGQGLMFWTTVQMWSPVLTAIWILFLGWFLDFLKARRNMLLASALALCPALPILLYQTTRLPRMVLILFWIGALAGMLPTLRKRPALAWKRILSIAMALDAVNLALVIPFGIAVWMRSGTLYYALEVAALMWILTLGSFLLSRTEGLSTPRAFAALLLAMLCQLWGVVSLFLMGIVPKTILKALFSV